jgi:rare lipoprotein A
MPVAFPHTLPLRTRTAAWLAMLVAAVLLVGCGTAPRADRPPRPGPADDGRDGAGANPPPNLAEVPDAQPRVESVRSGGPNKPYEALGRNYAPMAGDSPFRERGLASWYGRKFHGKPTASGEPYDMYAMTAAHPTLPIPSYARVRNPANGREVIVRINDRGPFHSGRIVDLSYTAALKLGVLRGVSTVELERITYDDIRSGAWRRDAAAPVMAQAPPPADEPPPVPAPALAPPAVVAAASAPAVVASAPETPATEDAPRTASSTDAAQGFWVQLGAFRQRDGAVSFRERVARELDWLAPLLSVFNDRSVLRLQAGPYRTRDEANGAAERIRSALQLVPVIVERR